jgi:hypothetical protein
VRGGLDGYGIVVVVGVGEVVVAEGNCEGHWVVVAAAAAVEEEADVKNDVQAVETAAAVSLALVVAEFQLYGAQGMPMLVVCSQAGGPRSDHSRQSLNEKLSAVAGTVLLQPVRTKAVLSSLLQIQGDVHRAESVCVVVRSWMVLRTAR